METHPATSPGARSAMLVGFCHVLGSRTFWREIMATEIIRAGAYLTLSNSILSYLIIFRFI